MNEPFSYTLDRVEELTGFSARVLAEGCAAGKIPHTKYGQKTVMTPEQIREFLARYERRPDAQQQEADPDVVAYMRRQTRKAAA